MAKTYMNLAVEASLHREIMLFKLKTNASSVGQIIRQALRLLKQELK